MKHKFNPARWNEKKLAKEDLDQQDHSAINSMPQLLVRLRKIELLLNIKSAKTA